MRLLSPQEQKNAELDEETRQKKTLADLGSAITQSIKALNELKEHDKAERERLKLEHEKFMQKLDEERANLYDVVQELESRRKEAMKPLTVIKAELSARKKEIGAKESQLDEWEKSLAKQEIEVSELADKYRERLGELDNFRIELNQREQKIIDEKKQFEISMRYKESVIKNERGRLREYFEKESRKLKQK